MRWYEYLDTNEKLIAFLRLSGAEDLINKFEKEGILYLSEIEDAVCSGDRNAFNSGDFIDFGET